MERLKVKLNPWAHYFDPRPYYPTLGTGLWFTSTHLGPSVCFRSTKTSYWRLG